RVTDPSSGFQALNHDAIALFANDYPHEFPEVEATVLVAKHRLRRVEVSAPMRERLAGTSSHGVLKSTYFLAKVLLALFVALFRRQAVPNDPGRPAWSHSPSPFPRRLPRSFSCVCFSTSSP